MDGYIFSGKGLEKIDVPRNKIGKFYKNSYVAESKEELIEYYVNLYNNFIKNARFNCEFEDIPKYQKMLERLASAIDS